MPQVRTAVLHGPHVNRALIAAVDAAVPWDYVLAAAEKLAPPAAAAATPPAGPPEPVEVPLSALLQALRASGHEALAARLEAPGVAWTADLKPAAEVMITLRPAQSGAPGAVTAGPGKPALRPAADRGGGAATSAAPPAHRTQPTLRPSMFPRASGGGRDGGPAALADHAGAPALSEAELVSGLSRLAVAQQHHQSSKGPKGLLLHAAPWGGPTEGDSKVPESHHGHAADADEPQPVPSHYHGARQPAGMPQQFSNGRGGPHALPLLGGRPAPDPSYDDGYDWDANVPHPSIRLNNAEENPLYKTQLCRHWMQAGQCRFGPACSFAHGSSDLRPFAGSGGGAGGDAADDTV